MFGLERGNNSFGTILILGALALVFFAQKGNKKNLRSTAASAERKEDEETMDREKTKVLYSRSLGSGKKFLEKEVLEGIDLKKEEEEKRPYQVLYSRSLGKDQKKGQEKEVQISDDQQPVSETRVLFSRVVKQNGEEKKPYNVLYSRSLGKSDLKRHIEEEVSFEEERQSKTKVHFSRILNKAGRDEEPVKVNYSRSLGPDLN